MRRRWYDRVQGDTVIVHLKSSSYSLKGIVAAVYSDAVELRDVVAVGEDDRQQLNGLIAVPRENIDLVQRLV